MDGPLDSTTAEVSGAGALRRVLVVDDSRSQRMLLARTLARRGYHVVEAASGAEALDICRAQQPDLILSDWMMPGMDGIAFCRAFRALPGDRYTYFILLTSKSGSEEIAEGLDSGADDFLTKPVESDELRARIAAGERILGMQHELTRKNRLISDTLAELQTVYAALDRDLVAAKTLQESLVRDRFVDVGGGVVSLFLRSSGHVGGDLVGHFPIGTDRLGLFGIDVSGHGISSALMTARLSGLLSSAEAGQNVALFEDAGGTTHAFPPEEVLRRLNAIVHRELETEHYFTMALAEVHLGTGAVSLAQGGHPHPLVMRKGGRIDTLGNGGLPIGLVEHASWNSVQTSLNPGDRLVFLSDGVTECFGRDGEMLTEAMLNRVLRKLADVPAEAFLDRLVDALTDFAGGTDFADDISGVVFERNR